MNKLLMIPVSLLLAVPAGAQRAPELPDLATFNRQRAETPAPVRPPAKSATLLAKNTKALARISAAAVLGNPDLFTISQVGDVLVMLDEVLSELDPSRERKEFDALRDAVDKVQFDKVRNMLGAGQSAPADKAEALTACADALRERLMVAIYARIVDYREAQRAFEYESLLRQRANAGSGDPGPDLGAKPVTGWLAKTCESLSCCSSGAPAK